MSAFVVGREHIDALVEVSIHGPSDAEGWWARTTHFYANDTRIDVSDPDVLGRMLWMENIRSVAYLYPDDGPADRPGPISENIDAEAQFYRYHPKFGNVHRLTGVSALKQIHCLRYQSCEHPGWATSHAKAFLHALTDRIISVLPGYDEAPWGL